MFTVQQLIGMPKTSCWLRQSPRDHNILDSFCDFKTFEAQCIYEIAHFDEWDPQFPPPLMSLTASLQIRLNQIPSKFQPPLPLGPQLSLCCSSKLSYWYISSTLILFQTQRMIIFTVFSLLFSKLSQLSQNDL